MSTFDEINQRFKEALGQIGGAKTERAITMITMSVQQETMPLVPVDTSVLIDSMYRYVRRGGDGWRGDVGFGADYALAVHNMPGTLKGQPRGTFGRTGNRSVMGPTVPRDFGGSTGVGNYWDPDAEPRFLEKGIDRTIPKLPGILREAYNG